MTWTKTEIKEAQNTLRPLLPPGGTVFTDVKHVSRSGMSRTIKAFVIEGTEIRDISRLVAKATDTAFDPKLYGVKMGGCGMDMGFALVYKLSRSLYPAGFPCIGKGCPANDHSNRVDTKQHKDGGYALRQRWL